jgi:hypothetical protein
MTTTSSFMSTFAVFDVALASVRTSVVLIAASLVACGDRTTLAPSTAPSHP